MTKTKGKLDIEALIEKYIINLQSDFKSKNTIKTYANVLYKLLSFIKQAAGSAVVSEADFITHCYNFIDTLNPYDKDTTQKKYKSRSIRTKRYAIKGFLSFLNARRCIEQDLSRTISSVKTETGSQKQVLSTDELVQIKNYLADNIKISEGDDAAQFLKVRNRMIFYTLVMTGMRVSELVNLRWKDVDFIKNQLLIECGKGDKTRYVPMLFELRMNLYDYKNMLMSYNNSKYNTESIYVFSNMRMTKTDNKGNELNLDESTVYRIIKRIVEEAGIDKKISPHNLRHTFASIAIKNKMNSVTLSKILGHSTPNITYEVYAHELTENEREQEMGKLEGNII